jgi:hypothetical protein
MNIFYILNNIYTNKNSKWIIELENNELNQNGISPFIIQRWLSMNDSIRNYVRWLDKYTFNIPTKMFISLAWSIIPKCNKAPFVTYIKKKTKEEEFEFILKKVRQHMMLSDNDYKALKTRILKYIDNDKYNWFSFYGIPKGYWKYYNLNFDKIKEFENTKTGTLNVGLAKWGLG